MTSKVKRRLTYLIQFIQKGNRSYYQIVSLTLRITDQNNDIITDGLETTVVLNIR